LKQTQKPGTPAYYISSVSLSRIWTIEK
jgi:hypothetical protein